MNRIIALYYGIVCYLVFFVTFLYMIGFVGNWVVPKTIDSGEPGARAGAFVINIGLLALFAIQHTIMARPGFKTWWAKVVPPPIERSTFVIVASLLLALMAWQWRAIEGSVFRIEAGPVRLALQAVSLAGWGIVLYASFLINHFELFGLRQVWRHYKGEEPEAAPFMERGLYKYVRHPLMLGFMIAFWATPDMTVSHLLFAIVTTGYVFVGIIIEERDILAELGAPYEEYRARTSMLIPMPRTKA